MKVRCVAYRASELASKIRERAKIREDYAFPVSVGKAYIVYAVSVFRHTLWYCICDDGYVHFSCWTPAGLFEIEDSRISKYWVFAAINDEDITCTLAYPQWAKDETDHYDRLAENMDPAIIIWEKYKKLIEEEAAE